jgi:phage shock protein A
VRQRIEAHVAQFRQDKAALSKALDALADEAGGACGRLQKQVTELQAQLAEQKAVIDEMRGEISLLGAQASTGRSQPRRIARANTREQDNAAGTFN